MDTLTAPLLWPIRMTNEGEIVCIRCDDRNPTWNRSLIHLDLNRFSAETLRRAIRDHIGEHHRDLTPC